MSTAAIVANNSAQQAAARRRREEHQREACAQLMVGYQHESATAAEKRQYAECVALTVPPEPLTTPPFRPDQSSVALVIVCAAVVAFGLWRLIR
jgi:hypothetical protein